MSADAWLFANIGGSIAQSPARSATNGSTIVPHPARPGRWTSVLVFSVALLLGSGTLASATGPCGWDPLGTGATPNSNSLDGRVDALISVPHYGAIPDSVYAGGVFTSAGTATSATMIARWDGEAWHSIGAPPISAATGASVHAI